MNYGKAELRRIITFTCTRASYIYAQRDQNGEREVRTIFSRNNDDQVNGPLEEGGNGEELCDGGRKNLESGDSWSQIKKGSSQRGIRLQLAALIPKPNVKVKLQPAFRDPDLLL